VLLTPVRAGSCGVVASQNRVARFRVLRGVRRPVVLLLLALVIVVPAGCGGDDSGGGGGGGTNTTKTDSGYGY